ncbi:hypothetical protein GCM10010371_49720 [Streptomyces subrutilus]|uniref:Uncharacterized protein n=1 Tax=Streptomyces subrutilus TaxID=36818 RepID=A0A918R2N3_9ACTN|nr:hypothetical protein GCM10010371_49720 [Streptomyces subrutilus]
MVPPAVVFSPSSPPPAQAPVESSAAARAAEAVTRKAFLGMHPSCARFGRAARALTRTGGGPRVRSRSPGPPRAAVRPARRRGRCAEPGGPGAGTGGSRTAVGAIEVGCSAALLATLLLAF